MAPKIGVFRCRFWRFRSTLRSCSGRTKTFFKNRATLSCAEFSSLLNKRKLNSIKKNFRQLLKCATRDLKKQVFRQNFPEKKSNQKLNYFPWNYSWILTYMPNFKFLGGSVEAVGMTTDVRYVRTEQIENPSFWPLLPQAWVWDTKYYTFLERYSNYLSKKTKYVTIEHDL